MSDREKKLLKLLGVMLVPCLILIWWFLGQDPYASSGVSRSKDDLASERSRFETYLKTLEERADILKRQGIIENFLPTSLVGVEAENQLSNEIAMIFVDNNITKPNVDPPRDNRIAGIYDYKFLEIRMRFSGTYARMCKLLYDFYQEGYIISDLSVASELDKDLCHVKSLTLMKLVMTSEAEQKRYKYMDERRGRAATGRGF